MAIHEKSTTAKPSSAKSCQSPHARMVQNYHLVWLDENIDEDHNDCRNSITKLRQVVNTVDTFIDVDECIDFINGIREEKTFMISSGALGQTIVPVIHDKSQVSTIYIFCRNKARHEKWTEEWTKIKGVYTDISPICEALKEAVQDCDHNTVSISLIPTTDGATNPNLDTLDQSFMYTQILKEILLTIDFEQEQINAFLTYCRELLAGNTIELKNVDKIEKEYCDHQPIWWYTYQSFLYSMFNRALRTMEVDLIVKMGFFVRDLHNQIVALHAEQYGGQSHSDSFAIYRGQGLSQTDFDQLKQTPGGLLSFNNFLSTSQNYDVSLRFARRSMTNSDLLGVLFVLKIDPSISATPFADIENVSYYKEKEKEILFAMHSVFRIGQVKHIDNNNRLWQVDLTITSDNDPQLHVLTETMRKETASAHKGWHRLGELMVKVSQFGKAEELYRILLQQTTAEIETASIFDQLGWIKDNQGEYAEAVGFYEKSLEILQKALPENHPDLATSYNHIGLVYDNMGEYSKALSYYEKALDNEQKTLLENHSGLATSYNNIGGVYLRMRENSKALSCYERDLEISQKILPANHPDLAISYNNIGLVHKNMGEYSKALSYHEKALEISQKALPENHPDFAISYNNIGAVYKYMGEYSKALSYYEKALEIDEKTLSANHPSLATSYNNIGLVYKLMGSDSKALSYYEKALEIYQKCLPANHPHLATSYYNIARVYVNTGDRSKALSYYERALDIRERSLPSNHPSIKNVMKSIKSIKKKL